MIFQVQIGQATTFEWSPAVLPDPSGAVTANFYANGVTLTRTLNAASSQAFLEVPDRYRVKLGELSSSAFAGLVGSTGTGGWYMHAEGFGQFPIRISHFDDTNNELILAEALPVGIPTNTSGTVYHNVWRCVISSDTLGTSVDRTGYYAINYQIDDDPGAGNTLVRLKNERGRLRVVRNRFDTGLTSYDLITLVPQLEATKPAAREGWQPYIDRYDIIGDIEAALPSDRFADMALGEQFRRAHALLVAASLAEIGYAPNVDPDKMREAAEAELRRQISRLHWLDADDDGEIDSGETMDNPDSLVSMTKSSNTNTKRAYDDQKRFRPVLDNLNDR